LSGEEGEHVSTGNLVVATLLAFVTGYAAIAWLLRFLSNHSTIVFVVYRVALGVLVLVLVSSGAIK
jgi:undecaprenyl-diphosphatase